MLEQFVSGDVYHVDSIVWDGQVVFAVAFKYGRPPMEIAHQGGLFITRRLPDDSTEGAALLGAEPPAAGGPRPAARRLAHRIHRDAAAGSDPAEPVFLETSARVGGAFIVDTIEAATGINLWASGRRSRSRASRSSYTVPPPSRRLRRHRAVAGAAGAAGHVGVYRRRDRDAAQEGAPCRADRRDRRIRARIDALIADYTQRFYRDFFATAPPPERPVE